MEITIEINPPAWLWFLPDSSIHLTDENPGPVTVDFSTLSKENQKLIILGQRNLQIKTSLSELNLIDIHNDKVPSNTQMTVVPDVMHESSRFKPEEWLKQVSSITLNKSLNLIKKSIQNMDDIRWLRIMLELEVSTRNRKSIIKCINSKLETLIAKVQYSIENDKSVLIDKTEKQDPLADALEIIDSEEEQREIEL